MNPLCIYHRDCADGFAAAWIVRHFYAGAVDFHAAAYGEEPPDVTGREVVIVDFSYKREVMLQLAAQASRVVVLDHHDTAERELQDLGANVVTIFDKTRCGAMIAWDHFFPGVMPPLLLDHIQDRDLWQFKLPMTREIMAAVFSYPMNFEAWDRLIWRTPALTLEQEGRAILRKHHADVEALIKNATRTVRFGSLDIPVANVPWMYASDVAGALAIGQPFAATYYDDADGQRWSLRSERAGADVAKIAEAFGGGGHQHAAGFRLTREEALDFALAGGSL